jgi:hypothetical protein
MESLRQFAVRLRLRVNDRKHERKYRLTTSEDTIHGRYGEIVADPSYDHFAVKFIAVPRVTNVNGALRNRYRAALAGGLVLKQKYGDAESTFHFDPANERQAALAVKLVGARRRRIVNMTPERRTALSARLAALRATKTAETTA